jgi:enoyl-CoA hydratase/carnithine racemase
LCWYGSERYITFSSIVIHNSYQVTEAQTALFEKSTLDRHYPDAGFAALTNRKGKKPIISAVNGHAHGGGMEIALNSDLVIASENATFSLPDVKRGTAALQGGLPRLAKLFGLQRAMLIALTGYVLGVQEAKEWGLVFKITKQDELIDEAVEMANLISSMSPDSIIVSRSGVRAAWEEGGIEKAMDVITKEYGEKLFRGENAKEGMKAFSEKRVPLWKGSKL